MRHFLNMLELDGPEIAQLLSETQRLKAAQKPP